MSRISSTAKRYAGSSYTSHYSSYSSSLAPGLSSYSERDRLSSYMSPMSSATSSSSYSSSSSSSYLSGSAARSRNYSTSSDPDRDRGRSVPRTDILGSCGRRSESLSRTAVKSSSGLNGGSAYTCYSSYPSSSTQSSYLSSSPAASGISLSRRKSVSQSDLSRDFASLGLGDASSSSPSSSTSALRSYRSRTSDASGSYGTTTRPSYSGLSRSATQEALSRSSTLEAFGGSSSSRSYSSSAWEPSGSGLSDSPTRDSTVRKHSGKEGCEGRKVRRPFWVHLGCNAGLATRGRCCST